MVFHALIIHLMIIFVFTTPTHNFPIAKPECVDRCGNINIPFPFGTTPECYNDRSFLVTCNHTLNTPKLFWGNSTIEITDISLDGQMKVMQFIARDCYARNGSRTSRSRPSIRLAQHFTANNIANKFTIVGCDAYGFVYGRRLDRNYETGCTAMCEGLDDLMEGSCMGLGCCQTSIPQDVWKVDIRLRSYSNYSNVSDFNNCGYAFLVEDKAFTFSKQNLTSLRNVESLPMVVDWAIGNGTCEEARTNASDYACRSRNSTCYNPENGYGYRCLCHENYQGNPYLEDGCKDVNECQDPSLNKCKHECVNTEGGHYCRCRKGYHGDGIIGGEGCVHDGESSVILGLAAGIAIGIIALLLIAILLYVELKRRSLRKTKQKFFLQNGGTLLQEKLTRREASPDMVKIFTSSELEKATNNFHNSMIVGQGGFGIVYKGLLPDKSVVAIKKSKEVDTNQIEQFINEVFVLSQINHRNVVRLLGCCLETEVPLLVYEFISNDTLSAHVHNHTKARFLNWETRLKIAAETAGVLSYYTMQLLLRSYIEMSSQIIYILIDDTFTTKVSDFGASRLVPQDLTQLSTMVQGTFGYLDPEYLQTNQLTEKSDVYSFGVVLLELLTGRKAISFDKTDEEKNLVNYFLSILKQQRLFEILDDNVVCDENMDQMLEVVRLAKECLNVRGEDRPSMKQVAMELEGMLVGGKHAWARNADNAEEIECLLDKDIEGLNAFEVDGGNSTSVGYDSIRDHILLPISGGRWWVWAP